MTTLTSQNTFTIGDASTLVAQATITVLPVAGAGQGRGRLVHPTLGTYDYGYAPDEWEGLDQDVLIAPVWASSRTLEGAANTLWPGHIKDVECTERWTSQLSMSMEQLRMLLSMWLNPPAPPSYVTWYPSYTTALGFKVILLGVTSGGSVLTLDAITRQGWAAGTIEQRLRVVDRV